MSDLGDIRALTRATRQYEAVLEETGLKGKNIQDEIRKLNEAIQMALRLIKTLELAQVMTAAVEASNPLTAGFAAFRIGATVGTMAMSEGAMSGR
jgi:predicted GTPase